MANHFRSSERQGDEELEQQAPATSRVPEEDADVTGAVSVQDVAPRPEPRHVAPAPTEDQTAFDQPMAEALQAPEPQQVPQADASAPGLTVRKEEAQAPAQPGFTSVFAPLDGSNAPVVARTGTCLLYTSTLPTNREV